MRTLATSSQKIPLLCLKPSGSSELGTVRCRVSKNIPLPLPSPTEELCCAVQCKVQLVEYSGDEVHYLRKKSDFSFKLSVVLSI